MLHAVITESDRKSRMHFLSGIVALSAAIAVAVAILRFALR